MPAAGSTNSFLHLATHQSAEEMTQSCKKTNTARASCVPTCWHQDERVLSLERGVNGLQLIEPELMETKTLVEDLHHLL